MMPPGLEKCAIPAEFIVQPLGGEFVLGVFGQADAPSLFLANHNCYAEQAVRLKLARANVQVEQFDRKQAKWMALPATAGAVELKLLPAGGELLRLGPK